MEEELKRAEESKQEREAKIILADSQKKYEELFRRLGVMEEELKRAEERASNGQKQLEVAEEKALAREEKFKEQIFALVEHMKAADVRAEFGEMNITKLNQRIDNIEDDIIREKM